MERLQAYKFELRPNGEQRLKMRRFAGACRFVYNRALALQKVNYSEGNKYQSYAAMCSQLPSWKKENETKWLKNAPSQVLQQTLKDLDKAYKNFFSKRASFPVFKKKGKGDSFRYPEPKHFKIDQANGRVFLPKLGWMRYCKSREVLGELRNITISKRAGKWFFSVQTKREVSEPVNTATTAVGIDLGVAMFASQSDGISFKPVAAFSKYKRRLANAQRSLARKKKFSNNWRKQKNKITRMHARIANIRNDYLHKTSNDISKNHAVVCIEDLKVGNMSRSSKGNAKKHGKNVKAKSGLNRSILDQGWFEFRRQLEYKLAWRGGWLIAVPPQHTSQKCSKCGYTTKENRKTQSKFSCISCGYMDNADINAAKNILAAGLAVNACGGDVRPVERFGVKPAAPLKQEPTEVIQACA